MQYVPTDLPQYWKLNDRSDFSNAVIPSDAVLLFSEDGQTLMAKTHQGTFITVGGEGSQDLDAYVVQSNSGVLYARKLKFNGTQASDSQTVELLSDSSVLIFNTGHPQPQGGGGGGSTPAASMDFYKCTYVNSDSWGGRKAVLNEGVYTFQSNSTAGLVYNDISPRVGNIYSQDAAIEISRLPSVTIPQENLIFYHPLDKQRTKDIAGNNVITEGYSGSVIYTELSGRPCAVIADDTGQVLTSQFTKTSQNFTLSCWIYYGNYTVSDYCQIFCGIGATDAGKMIAIGHAQNGVHTFQIGLRGTWYNSSVTIEPYKWYHLCVVKSGDTLTLYINGSSGVSGSYTNESVDNTIFILGRRDNTFFTKPNSAMSSVRLYNRVLTQTEITALSQQFALV